MPAAGEVHSLGAARGGSPPPTSGRPKLSIKPLESQHFKTTVKKDKTVDLVKLKEDLLVIHSLLNTEAENQRRTKSWQVVHNWPVV